MCFVFMIVLRIGATSGGFSDWISLYDQPPEIVRGKGNHGYYDNPAPIRDAMLVAQKHVLLVLVLVTAIASLLLAAVLLSPRVGMLDRIRWKIFLLVPFVSRVVRSGLAARFFSALRGLMAAGIPVPRSLELTKGMLAGTPMENAADRILAVSSDGNSLSDGISADRLFPPGVAAFLKAGESTGKVLDTLRVLEQMHRERWESGVAFARSFAAPAFEIMAGLAVMAVTLGMLFSYLNLLGGIQATLSSNARCSDEFFSGSKA
jgi:type II secretory pathway component PulF